MSKDIIVPDICKDASDLLTDDGFTCSNVWYHGTTSAHIKAIKNKGIHGGADSAWTKRTQGTLSTIGNRNFESSDPVFLTQSKELAYFWAQQRAHARNLYFRNDEEPVVFRAELPEGDNAKVRPDVGGAAMAMEPGNAYLVFLKDIYEASGKTLEEFNPLKADRMDYLNRLGLAYTDDYIPGKFLELVYPVS